MRVWTNAKISRKLGERADQGYVDGVIAMYSAIVDALIDPSMTIDEIMEMSMEPALGEDTLTPFQIYSIRTLLSRLRRMK